MKHLKVILTAVALLTVLSGCGFSPFTASGEDLYQLPKLPPEYESLEAQLDELIRNGAEHVSPTSGSNLQSVQMVDLNNDGVEEAVAFLRRNDDEKPMKIYVFRAVQENYELAYTIEGTSTSIYSIAYIDLDGDGWKELLTGLRSGLDVQTLTVFSISEGEPRTVLTTGYSRYLACDLDSDGMQELVVIRGDEENVAQADRYIWQDNELVLSSSENCMIPVPDVTRLISGALSGGENALFLTGTAEESAITEVLSVREGNLLRIETLLSPQSELYPNDINNDGITEVPELSEFPKRYPEEETFYRIFWHSFDINGSDEVVSRAFYNTVDGWNLFLPQQWDEGVGISRFSTGDYSTVSFCRISSDPEEAAPFLTIACFSGENRGYQTMHEDWLQLARQVDAVYVAKLYDADPSEMDEQTLYQNFSLIAAEWTTGEN